MYLLVLMYAASLFFFFVFSFLFLLAKWLKKKSLCEVDNTALKRPFEFEFCFFFSYLNCFLFFDWFVVFVNTGIHTYIHSYLVILFLFLLCNYMHTDIWVFVQTCIQLVFWSENVSNNKSALPLLLLSVSLKCFY